MGTLVEEFGRTATPRAFTRLKSRGIPFWWLDLSKCPTCDQHWLVAQEERLNDVYVFSKCSNTEVREIQENNQWPQRLSSYEELLEESKKNGHEAYYAIPDETIRILIDLIGQRPTITVREVADLVNLEKEDAARIFAAAAKEIQIKGYPYPWAAA